MATLIRNPVDRYVEAWNAHDPAACASSFTQDGVREWKILPLPLIGGKARFEGRKDVEESIRLFMEAVPDLTVETLSRHAEEGRFILEWLIRGTHTGAWESWAPQGERVEFPGVSIYEMEGNLFHEERMYFDAGLMAANWRPPKP